jgi:hypothetical protein
MVRGIFPWVRLPLSYAFMRNYKRRRARFKNNKSTEKWRKLRNNISVKKGATYILVIGGPKSNKFVGYARIETNILCAKKYYHFSHSEIASDILTWRKYNPRLVKHSDF